LLRDATGRRRHAEEYYRKALYLDPHHAEAAMHLALLMDQAGKPSEAAVLRSRVKRIASHGERQS
jgi:chemotaxis protein methyltransferase WspC